VVQISKVVRHVCDKEVEIAEMHQDIKYIRKALEGNGVPGLIKNVDRNTNFRVGSEAKSSMIKYLVGGGWLTTLVVLIISLIK